MDKKLVARLMAGVIGTEYYGLDEDGKVFLLDAAGNRYEIKDAALSQRVRDAINRSPNQSGEIAPRKNENKGQGD